MNRDTLLHLTMTADPNGSAWLLGDAKDRMERTLRSKLTEVLLSTKGPITLTLELYKEDT